MHLKREQSGEGQAVAVTGAAPKPSQPMRSKRMSEGHWDRGQTLGPG